MIFFSFLMKEKCLIMFSGGLDSRLAVKIMQEKGFDILAVFFKLPFGTGCCNEGCSFNFSQMQGIKLKVVDCSKGKLLQEYLKILKEAKNGRGAGVNPCIDCKIFILKKAKEIADKEKINYIVTGEVIGQRPMSQQKNQLEKIEQETGLIGRIIRPLSDYLGIKGRQRKEQMSLAKRYNIKYPSPGGGCVLCEKQLRKRFSFLLKRGLNDKEIDLVNVGRHFLINNCWVILGRNQEENKILEKFNAIFPEGIGPSALILDKSDKDTKEIVKILIKAYSKKSSLDERKKFERYIL